MITEPRNQSLSWRASRLGTWLIPIGALLMGLVFTYFLTSPDSGSDPVGAAEFRTGAVGYSLGIVYILATIALLLGLVALYACLSHGPAGGWALAALVLGVTSLGLLLAADGVFILATASVGVLLLDGNAAAGDVLARMTGGDFNWPVLVAFLAAVALALAAGIAYAVAIWRSSLFPKWTAILLCIGLLFLTTSTPLIGQLGSLLLVVAGVVIARTIGQTSVAVDPAQAR
ncbi:MAG TPA: hypothetical protein VMM78_02100 [Thermomicrobiales bacterium]|nr:hypothetical protein [Thermomicrobiales bacterium]